MTMTHHGTAGTERAGGEPESALLPPAEREEFARRLHHAVNGFVDEPRRSVEEADALFDEVFRRIGALVAEQRHGLRAPWHGEGAAAGTEDLRNVLRRYRDATERLLRL
ncbi:hypothetical protein GCM10010420_08940 [Streptomyces glaucosporus]|uniref:Uncharacterized protein n=1 Tax=Streptomyces glaucosporus TaxID=284044 RepID=A0ABN3HU65_9ACTN